MSEFKTLLRKKFIFANIALFIATVTTFFLKYEGPVYVQLFGIVVTGFLASQAYVDARTK